jgi:predicted enzyme related to lactoylglutathione lyase
MTIERVLAQMTVSDLASASDWYSRLFDRGPDANPMEGLLEWHLADAFGVQVWAEPDRAGHSSVVLDETDLDGRLEQLTRNGIDHGGAQEATASRIAVVTDPEGNRIVFTGPFAGTA